MKQKSYFDLKAAQPMMTLLSETVGVQLKVTALDQAGAELRYINIQSVRSQSSDILTVSPGPLILSSFIVF